MNYGVSTVQANSIANATFTKEQLAAFIAADPENALSFAIDRNPTVVYKYIRQNYGSDFPNLKSGAEVTNGMKENMCQYLLRKYNNLDPSQRAHFLYTVLHSLPDNAQFPNWTTPIN